MRGNNNTMKEESEYLTKEKFDELTKELDYLRTEKRREVAENLEYAKGLGDLSENAEYHEARETQANIEDRIAKLEVMLKSAVIMGGKHGDTISVGSVVTVAKKDGKTKQTFTLVGSEEVDVSQGKISIHSPLGNALVGKRKSADVEFKTPAGVTHYTIVDVR